MTVLNMLSDELLEEVFSHLAQEERLKICLICRRWNKIAMKLVYRRIYLNDSNVVMSDFANLAINWTLLSIPSFLMEQDSRKIADIKLGKLIRTFEENPSALAKVQWIRINWDLDPILQRRVLYLLCNYGDSLERLENVTDPSCNDIIANGNISREKVISFEMAPPNPLPELPVPEEYIPNLMKYVSQRISTRISHMTLFIDPIKLFNYLHPLNQRLQITDLKLHWRREFYSPRFFQKLNRKVPLRKLSEVFDIRSLKVLTIVSWDESLMDREIEMIKEFKAFVYLEDLSLISIKQDIKVLVSLFHELVNLRRLKMDFLYDYIPEATSPHILSAILLTCKRLQFIDIRFEGVDPPIITLDETNRFKLRQKCSCKHCVHVFENILKGKIFINAEDYIIGDLHDIGAKDIFKMMRYLTLLPYSKACDRYPSVRTQPMNLSEFVKRMNDNLFIYRQSRSNAFNTVVPHTTNARPANNTDTGRQIGRNIFDREGAYYVVDQLPADPGTELQRATTEVDLSLTCDDVVDCYHTLIHHYRSTYLTFLIGFSELQFLMLNDIPTMVVESNGERIFEPVFYHRGYTSNLHGWTHKKKRQLNTHDVAKRATVI